MTVAHVYVVDVVAVEGVLLTLNWVYWGYKGLETLPVTLWQY